MKHAPAPARPARAWKLACSGAAMLLAGCAATQATPAVPGPTGVPSEAPPVAPSTRPGPVLEAKPTTAPVTGDDDRPNIVLITTDDQTSMEMQWMPKTRRLLGGAGVTFPNAISPHPLCCPARAEILTGQYAQNNGVRDNYGPYGGYQAFDPSRTIATWLDAARYQTAFVGKHLNGYQAGHGRDPGWDIWNPIVRNVYRYYGFTMFNDGQPRRYERIQSSDLLSRKTADYIERFSKKDAPFFVWASHVAPHAACVPLKHGTCWVGPVPAKRHERMFDDVRSPTLRSPAFNERDVSDKPPAIRRQEPKSPEGVSRSFQRRIRSLQAVDESVAATIRTLRRTGELDDTIVMFTSDNGYLLGLHRYMFKDVPYEEALSVPLLVRGPGIPAGATREQTVTTVDLAATFADAAGAGPTVPLDGRSILPLIADPRQAGYDTVLIQGGPKTPAEEQAGWRYRGVRTDRYTYVRYPTSGFTELYDRRVDPHQLENISGDPGYAQVEAELDRRTTVLGGCSGAGCRQPFPPLPDPS